MVPLCFIAESTQAYVLWNSKQRVEFVAKPSEEVTKILASSSLDFITFCPRVVNSPLGSTNP